MFRSLKALANATVFANRKNRRIAIQAHTNDYATLHAHFAHALYLLCGSWRPGLCAVTASPDADATARQSGTATMHKRSWMSGKQPCTLVRRGSPAVVVVA